ARQVRELIRQLHARGKTVLLSTHYMGEAEELCDRLAILNKGQIALLGSPEQLRNRLRGGAILELTVESIPDGVIGQLRSHPDVEEVEVVPEQQLVRLR